MFPSSREKKLRKKTFFRFFFASKKMLCWGYLGHFQLLRGRIFGQEFPDLLNPPPTNQRFFKTRGEGGEALMQKKSCPGTFNEDPKMTNGRVGPLDPLPWGGYPKCLVGSPPESGVWPSLRYFFSMRRVKNLFDPTIDPPKSGSPGPLSPQGAPPGAVSGAPQGGP